MSAKLTAGDRCYFLDHRGYRIRVTVQDALPMRERGKVPLIAVARVYRRSKAVCALDGHAGPPVLWKPRTELRKLPAPRTGRAVRAEAAPVLPPPRIRRRIRRNSFLTLKTQTQRHTSNEQQPNQNARHRHHPRSRGGAAGGNRDADHRAAHAEE